MLRKLLLIGYVVLAAANLGASAPEFRPRVSLNIGDGGAYGVAAGDYDGDGRPDLAVANAYRPRASVFFGQADGSLASPVTLNFPYSDITPIVAANLNRDGCADLICRSAGTTVLYGQANRTFTSSNIYNASPSQITVSDLNADGIPDIVATGTAGYDQVARIFYGQPSGGFSNPSAYSIGVGDTGYKRGMAIADFNLDGYKDVAVTNPSDHTISVLYRQASGGFSRTDYPGGRCYGMVSGDFNRDGRPDLAYPTFFGQVGVLLGQASGGFSGPSYFSLTKNFSDEDIACGDFNHDGLQDLVTVTSNYNNVTLLFGSGDGTFGGKMDLYASANGSALVTVADLDANGWDDVAVASASGGYADVFYAVPEPSALALLVIGAIGLACCAWRRAFTVRAGATAGLSSSAVREGLIGLVQPFGRQCGTRRSGKPQKTSVPSIATTPFCRGDSDDDK